MATWHTGTSLPNQQQPLTRDELEEMNQHAAILGGQLQHPPTGSHSRQDYQNQLMVLEMANKKRLLDEQRRENRSDR
jgi:hypothetical protein